MKTGTWFVIVVGALSAFGCKREDPAQQPQPYGAQQQPYGQQQQPYGQQQQPYGQQQPPPQQQQPPPATGGFPPAPLSPPCQQLEGTCGFARCNMQAGRCAFPCNGPQDCIQGSTCLGAGTLRTLRATRPATHAGRGAR